MKKKPSPSRFRIRPKTKQKIKDNLKKSVNINTYNKYLFLFETILFIGAIEEFIETKVLALETNFYISVILIMLLIGTAFTFAVVFLEPKVRNLITWIVRASTNRVIRVVVHSIILFGLFLLYAFVYFGAKLMPVFSFGLKAV